MFLKFKFKEIYLIKFLIEKRKVIGFNPFNSIFIQFEKNFLI
ncbi:hypothetical protein RIEPE_0285 [Candidatus Riesia pediculicola USDA]|uniref:Uncharacterized protein n=1 Tax=Riesia pediculicola (strain USDA) TaxID=515618 RepID=D4G880_RIEPU|nr:hypothetical protein RIEPE_0285 [Candidatus Riesia pediculicola USDA]